MTILKSGPARLAGLAALFCFFGLARVYPVRAQAVVSSHESLELPYTSQFDTGIYHTLNRLPESVRKSDAYAREVFELEREAGSSGLVDHVARAESFAKSQQDLYRASADASKSGGKKYSLLSDAWTNIGPNVVTTPSTYTVGGCTNAIAIDPNNTNIMYAGAAGGGVWKTTDAGANWTALTDNVIPDLAVATIAIDPNHTNIIYAGSGDGFSAIDMLNGSGLYKSTDAGSSWSKIGSSIFTSGVMKVLVHPTKSNIVFASGFGASQGLYRSTDTGATWTKVYTPGGVVWDVCPAGSSGTNGIFYLVDGNNFITASTNCGLYKSTNDGGTWTKISSGMPRGDSINRAAVVCPSGNTSKVYVLMSVSAGNSTGDLLGMFQSTNSGSSFVKMTGLPTTLFKPFSYVAAQGWYDLFLGISPNAATHDTLFIGGVEGWYNRDDGHGWVQFAGYGDYQNGNPHVDLHSMALNPLDAKKVFIGTDGGIYYSTDAAGNWVSRSNGYSTLRIYHIALDKNDNATTYAGAQDEGSWHVTNGASQDGEIFDGDGFQPMVDPTNSNVFYVGGPHGAIYKWIQSQGWWSDDLAYSIETGQWDCPVRLAPSNHNYLYTARTHVWKSINQGTNWTSISPQLNGGTPAYSLGLSPASASVIWVGFTGLIKWTANGGTNWNTKSTGLPNSPVNYIVCHPYNPNWALVAFGSSSLSNARVMLTKDQGATFTNVSGTGTGALPASGVNAIALDSINPGSTWYAATNNGLYYTLDTGKTWVVAGTGIGLAPCWDVQIHADGTTIRVGTHGRGIYEAAANVLPVELDGLTARTTSTGTELAWHTDSEHGNLRFDIMRSYNYQPFEVIGSTPGAPGGNSSTTRSYQFFDSKHDTGSYLFQLAQVDLDGTIHYSNHVEVHYGPQALQLQQNYPNPLVLGPAGAYVTTRIHYSLATAGSTTLRIYSATGALIRTLLDHESQNGGPHDVFWDGSDAAGRRIAAGTYYYALETSNGDRLWNKMLVLE